MKAAGIGCQSLVTTTSTSWKASKSRTSLSMGSLKSYSGPSLPTMWKRRGRRPSQRNLGFHTWCLHCIHTKTSSTSSDCVCRHCRPSSPPPPKKLRWPLGKVQPNRPGPCQGGPSWAKRPGGRGLPCMHRGVPKCILHCI